MPIDGDALGSIDWGSLSHAHGPAYELPGLLRAWWAFPDGCGVFSIVEQNGSVIAVGCTANGTGHIDPITLPVGGTYTLSWTHQIAASVPRTFGSTNSHPTERHREACTDGLGLGKS